MAKVTKTRTNYSMGGVKAPDWKTIQPGMKPITENGIRKGYTRLLNDALQFAHTEVADKTISSEFIKYCGTRFDKETVKTLKKLPDFTFTTVGKYAYLIRKGVGMTDEILEQLERQFNTFIEMAAEVADEPTAEKAPGIVISIQDRMREQMETLFGDIEGVVDEWMEGKSIAGADPYKMIIAYEPGVKPAHAKIIRDTFAPALAEAKEVAKWSDEEMKEAYSFTTAKSRKELVTFYEKLNTACDTVIGTGKAVRKTRKPKAVAKDKLVAKLKYKESEPSIGIASINPVSIIEAQVLWVFNTKTRKLGVYVADEMTGPLSVKGTTIQGFDPVKSIQKTIRKPEETLKGADKLARTKIQKLFDGVRATETKMNGRINQYMVLVKVF